MAPQREKKLRAGVGNMADTGVHDHTTQAGIQHATIVSGATAQSKDISQLATALADHCSLPGLLQFKKGMTPNLARVTHKAE